MQISCHMLMLLFVACLMEQHRISDCITSMGTQSGMAMLIGNRNSWFLVNISCKIGWFSDTGPPTNHCLYGALSLVVGSPHWLLCLNFHWRQKIALFFIICSSFCVFDMLLLVVRSSNSSHLFLLYMPAPVLVKTGNRLIQVNDYCLYFVPCASLSWSSYLLSSSCVVSF